MQRFVINAMKQASKKQLTQYINLVKWEESKKVEKYSLLTIHSLLLNANPKFIQLKKIVEDFNHKVDKKVDRKHLQEQYIKKLYSMLSQMILIPISENQQKFLNKVYDWATKGDSAVDFDQSEGGKSRPTTASTRARPFSAYSRPKSGVRTLNNLKREEPDVKVANRDNKAIDYDKLRPGEVQFYNGMRTLHQGEENPRKQLSQYRRKVFYDEEPDSDLQVLDLQNQKQKDASKMGFESIPVQDFPSELKKAQQEPKQQEGLAQGEDQLGEEELGEPEDDINIDDLPIEGQVAEQETEVIDKLKPRLQSYINHQTDLSKNVISYNRGVNQVLQDRNSFVRKKQEDEIMRQKMAEWARQKSRSKRQHNRRAESARMVTQRLGIARQPIKEDEQNFNIINFESVNIHQTKPTRPKTGFMSTNLKNREELISKCFVISKLAAHITPFDKTAAMDNQRYARVSSLAEKPKKKTFQEILRDAENKVKGEEMDEIISLKDTFAKNKVPFETNRIAKSITCHTAADRYENEDNVMGVITGMNMLNNPFFKAGKKKKKKKKSKK